MSETEFEALVSLLDDEDPAVESHVRQTLLSLGDAAVPRLEFAWEQSSSEVVQQRLESIIHVIQSQAAIARLRAWEGSDGQPLFEGWLGLTQYQFPSIAPETYRKEISRLVNRAWLDLRAGMNLVEQIGVISRLLFASEQYRGNRRSLFDPQNYFLNGLIETRRGGPVSLGTLFLIICQELELPLHGMVLPGYFVLRNDGGRHELFVDVFNKGAVFFRSDLQNFLSEVGADEDDPAFARAASHVDIVREIAHQLIVCYHRKKQSGKAAQWESLLGELGWD
ncbi:MAG: transglutaminase-like domain-containing protein [Bacteroidia bacterium]|nr:transglutaminase-like domain-containing protein [Bacteroidia bacterium]